MLKFWKKTGQKENASGSASSSPGATPRNQRSPISNGGFHIGSLWSQIEELEILVKEDTSQVKRSRLSKTLAEVISDNEALAYFIQYLETIGHGALIKFILDVNSFDAALLSTSNSKYKNNVSSGLKNELVHSLINQRTNSDSSVTKNPADVVSDNNESDSGCEKSKSSTSSNISSDTKVNQNEVKEKNLFESNEGKMLSRLLSSSDVSESVVDAVKIFQKYFSHNAPLKIRLEQVMQQRLINNLQNHLNESTFTEAKEYVLKILEKEHFNDFLRSEFHCKYQIDVLTSNKVYLSDILYNDTALFYLMEYLEQEGCTSLLEFWISALNFQQQYQDKGQNYDPMQAQDDAMVLYDKYFSLQATHPLFLGDNVRIQVEESICREEGPLPSCFEYPQKLIVKLLETKFLDSFLQSQLYFKYLSELITTIQASPALCSRSRNSGGSDCSSEISISATNTLLVSEDINPPKRIFKHLSNSSMSIDTQQLYDPDSLWRRGPKRPGLSFGRINSLGRFETDLEPEPDRKEESRIAKAMKKFVNLDEDKSKEEMAWQVAAMIVKDVTNVTMPSSTES